MSSSGVKPSKNVTELCLAHEQCHCGLVTVRNPRTKAACRRKRLPRAHSSEVKSVAVMVERRDAGRPAYRHGA